jgi:hypothetical protein
MVRRQRQNHGPEAVMYWGDSRECSQVPKGWADLIITSPPYANNYDYADATRLEMSFFGEIEGWGNLQDAVRKYLVRSCTQHVGKLSKETYKIIADPLLTPIKEELTEVCKQLEVEKEDHGGKKQYHTMIAAYFSDLARVWQALRRITSEDGHHPECCVTIDSKQPLSALQRWIPVFLLCSFTQYSAWRRSNSNG